MDRFNERLSEYLDDELTPGERAAFEAHLGECRDCRDTLAELREVISRAASLVPRPPESDLWDGIAAQLEGDTSGRVVSIDRARGAVDRGPSRRFSFTAAQLAAAAALLIVTSAGVSWLIRSQTLTNPSQQAAVTQPVSTSSAAVDAGSTIRVANFADAQYDAAVSDLQRALNEGRGRLDRKTIEVLERNLAIIDQAIEQARKALAADPANTYLNSYLADARRRKLDLLRDVTASLANLPS
jgi:anti-sigma factor RsiW